MQNKLSSAPAGKNGWPWLDEIQPMPSLMPDGKPWPKVSIVTPSFNQAFFLEETIRSVLLQGYPNLEYIIIDGGSTDGSVDIIRKYEQWLAYWSSELDEGQSDALNKGFQRSTGSIFAWINSDDYYLPGVFSKPVIELDNNPDLVMVYGDCYRVNEAGEYINTWQTSQVTAFSLLMDGNQIPQQSTFICASAMNAIDGIDHKLDYVMDHALWLCIGLVGELKYLPGPAANFRKHIASKGVTAGYAFLKEWLGWLSEWDDLDQVLLEGDQVEMFRRQHIVAALYAIFEGNQLAAVHHFNISLKDGVWPYGDIDKLVQKIVRFGGMGGHTMADSWDRYRSLHRVIDQVEPVQMGRQLWQCVAAKYQIRRNNKSFLGRIIGKMKSIIARRLL
jgi:glycosyltransferase involved in cell wall biosynthesis